VIGSTIDGKYQIHKLLGEGAMGAVYEAEHTATGRRVAVKVISSADLTKDPKVVSRFQREARAAGAIDTQHITQVLDAGVDRESGLPFLAMEFMSGEDLMALIKRVGAIAPDIALRIVAQACLGMQKAHDAGVVHRDIKPHNLFLARRDAGEVIVKLLDFGIAKVKMDQANDTENAELTRTGNLLGSPLYMSPEQARGQKDIDLRTDLWSLGAVLYQALTGRTPYHHITALGQLIIAICSEPPPPVQDFAPWVSPEVASIVHRCLQQDPNRRFQSAAQMFEAIRPLLPYGWGIHQEQLVSLQDSVRHQAAPRMQMSMPPPGAGISGSYPTIPPPGALPSTATTTAALSTSQSQSVQPQKSSGIAVVGIAAALLLVVAGTGIYFFTRPPAEPPQAQLPAPTATAAPAVAPTATATAVAAAEPAAQASKRVYVVIIPTDASVEVEGAKVALKDGLLEINGIPGSVKRVRVSKGTGESIADVVVTEAGALPPKIEVKIGVKTTVTAAPTGAAPAVGTAPPVPAAPPNIKTNTDEFGN
jgi:serine/threonine-protein kinase